MALDDLIKRRIRNRASDDQARDFAKGAARKFSTGKFTATQTGAKELAARRGFESDMGELSKSLTGGTETSEGYIRSRKYRAGK